MTLSLSFFDSLTHLGNGYYSIRSAASNLYVTVKADHLNQGNYALTQTAYSGLTSQKWKISISSHGSYVLRPMSGTSWCMSAGDGIGSSGRNVEQRTYSDNEDYLDEWYINSFIRIGLSTDDCDSGGCSHSSLNSCLYGTKFYDSLQFAKTKVHHYNKGTAHAASPNDFSANGAIDSNVNFMVYIGHGHAATNAYGNHFHYDCGRFDVDHSACDSGLCANGVYTSTVKFGSATSQLRCVWLYTCNFMNENDYVTEDDLKSMLNGAHIVIGYGTKAYLLQNVAIDYAERLSKGEPIIDALGNSCAAYESLHESQDHFLRYVCYESARYENIFTPYRSLIGDNIVTDIINIPKFGF